MARYFFSLWIAVALLFLLLTLTAWAEPVRVPEQDCVNNCVLLKRPKALCETQCPAFYPPKSHERDDARYAAYRRCVNHCLQNPDSPHLFYCATRRCRVK